MDAIPRKKSPRVPVLSLEDAIERVDRIYKHEGRHAAPTDVVAQHLGYKGSKNGAALQTLASLGYYGLVQRPKDGQLMVAKEFESYQYAPDESVRRNILLQWIRTPPVFAELLDRYEERLPSDGSIKFELIQKGFTPTTAETCLNVFKRSVDFVKYYDVPLAADALPATGGKEILEVETVASDPRVEDKSRHTDTSERRQASPVERADATVPAPDQSSVSPMLPGYDRIPVRLGGARRAWIEVPTPFYKADKARLIAQIEFLLADDEHEEDMP